MADAIHTIWMLAGRAMAKGQRTFDTIIPPATRNEYYRQLQQFVSTNPKLASFIAINMLLSSAPIAMFVTFIGTVFTCAIVIALSTVAFFFSLALVFLLPTLLVTTIAATSLWCMAMTAYWLFLGYTQKRKPTTKAPITGSSHIRPEQSTMNNVHANGSLDPSISQMSGDPNGTPFTQHQLRNGEVEATDGSQTPHSPPLSLFGSAPSQLGPDSSYDKSILAPNKV